MNKLNRNSLESSYMSPSVVHFYTTDWSSNGTTGLIITDDMEQIIGYIDEALFRPTISDNSCGDTLGGIFLDPHGESIHFIGNGDQPTEEDLESKDRVYPLRFDQVMDSIAESPVQSRLSILKQIVAIIKTEKRTLVEG